MRRRLVRWQTRRWRGWFCAGERGLELGGVFDLDADSSVELEFPPFFFHFSVLMFLSFFFSDFRICFRDLILF